MLPSISLFGALPDPNPDKPDSGGPPAAPCRLYYRIVGHGVTDDPESYQMCAAAAAAAAQPALTAAAQPALAGAWAPSRPPPLSYDSLTRPPFLLLAPARPQCGAGDRPQRHLHG